MKRYRRITAGVLVATLLATLPGMDNIKVFAEQKIAERQSTKELIVSSISESFDTFGAADCISIGDGLYVLSYGDEAGTENAYGNYKQMEGILFADKNIAVTAQTEEVKAEDIKTEEMIQSVKDAQIKESGNEQEQTIPEKSDDREDKENSSKEDEAEAPETEQTEESTSNGTDIPQEDNIIRVAVIDTGISPDIANLAPYITDTGINVSESGEAGSTLDDNGHGTAMAQVIVSALEENGKNSDSVKLLPIKALNAEGNGTILSAYQGIKAAIEQKADIICLGFSEKGESKLLEQAVNTAYEQGITVTAPVGNDSEDVSAYIPGCYEKAVVVGNAKNKSEADNSNYGDTVDFAAYGTKEILSLTGEPQTVTGSSISCAYVTGIAASFSKGLSCEEREAGLMSCAEPTTDENLKSYFGKGLVGDVPEKEEIKETKDKKTGETKEKDADEKKVSEKKSMNKKGKEINVVKSSYGASAGETVYCTADQTPSVDAGCHAQVVSIFPCIHTEDSKTVATVKSTLQTLYPTEAQLKSSVVVTGENDDVPLKVVRKDVIPCEGVGLTDGIKYGKPDVPHIAMIVTLGNVHDIKTVTLASPAANNPFLNPKPQGYAYFQYSYSYCKHTKEYYFVNQGHSWLEDLGGGKGTPESYSHSFSHTIAQYKIKKNESTVYFNANNGTIAEEPHKNGKTYYELNSNGTVVCSSSKNGTYTAKTKTVTYGGTMDPPNVTSFGITREGYHLATGKEWYADIDGKRVYFNQNTAHTASTLFPNIKTKNGETLTLYANWEEDKGTIYYSANNGSIPDEPHYNASKGKYYSLDANGYVTYTNTEGKTGAESTSVKSTSAEKDLYNVGTFGLKKEGYKPKPGAEWKTSLHDDGISFGQTTKLTAADWLNYIQNYGTNMNLTLYVNWIEKTYDITYHANDGTDKKETAVKSYFKAHTIKDCMFSRAGYDFVGWSTEKDGKVNSGYAPGKSYDTNENLNLYAIWRENYKVAYIGNGQTKGSDFIDEGKDRLGHSEKENYTFDGNTQKSGTESNISLAYIEQANREESLKQANEQFSKEETITYVDEQTNREENTYAQKIESTVVGWKLYKVTENRYDLRAAMPGKNLMSDAESRDNITKNAPNSDYGQFREDVLTTGVQTIYGSSEAAVLPNLGAGNTNGTIYNGTPYVNLYADWDMGPKIEAYDRYYTLDEAQRGFITEDELLNAAKATDKELISESNTEGVLKNHEDTENGTSFVVWDYDADLFKELTCSCMISQIYRAEDEAGNVTEQMINVHIVDGTDTIIDGHDIGVDPDKGEVRFISEKYLYTIEEQNSDSIWVRNEEYKQVLEETVKIKRVNPKRSEPVGLLKAFGDKYTIPIPGTGTWTKEPQFVWEFTRAEIDKVKAFIEEHGPSNYVEEDALDLFIAEFDKCFVK